MQHKYTNYFIDFKSNDIAWEKIELMKLVTLKVSTIKVIEKNNYYVNILVYNCLILQNDYVLFTQRIEKWKDFANL